MSPKADSEPPTTPVLDGLNGLSLDPPATLHPHAQFHLFLTLPPELRLHIYEAYFAHSDPSTPDATITAPKSHSSTRHSTALLLASRQTHEEGLRVFHRCATLALNLDPTSHRHVRDMAFFLDHLVKPGEYFAGDVARLAKIRNVHLTLSRPSDATAPKFAGGGKWRQLVVPVFWSTVQLLIDVKISHLSIAVNVGDITAFPPLGPPDSTKVTFASLVQLPFFTRYRWLGFLQRAREQRSQRELSAEEVLAAGHGRRFARGRGALREAKCMLHVAV